MSRTEPLGCALEKAVDEGRRGEGFLGFVQDHHAQVKLVEPHLALKGVRFEFHEAGLHCGGLEGGYYER